MKIFVAGATGIIGKRAVRELVAAGHEVTGVARTDEKARLLDELGAKPVTCDVFDAADVKAHAGGHDAVVNLLTHIPPLSKAALPGAWTENDRLRTEASANLAAASDGRFIQESITFLYLDAGDEWITEDSPREATKFVVSTDVAEQTALAVGGVVLRFAQFYAPEASHTVDSVRMARRGLAPAIGDPEGYGTYVYADDAARAVVAALDAPSGEYNVAEDEPLTRREGAALLAAALGKQRLRTGLAKVGAKLIGSQGSLLSRSNRISNAKIKAATGWKPEVPSQREGWPRIVAEMDA
ncbi:MAG TPA: NAD(P)H-binding protein [Acidimicrobiales bacterium]|nr:NAD(P)H-binding protein [Acidimicrobiales bacterium]